MPRRNPAAAVVDSPIDDDEFDEQQLITAVQKTPPMVSPSIPEALHTLLLDVQSLEEMQRRSIQRTEAVARLSTTCELSWHKEKQVIDVQGLFSAASCLRRRLPIETVASDAHNNDDDEHSAVAAVQQKSQLPAASRVVPKRRINAVGRMRGVFPFQSPASVFSLDYSTVDAGAEEYAAIAQREAEKDSQLYTVLVQRNAALERSAALHCAVAALNTVFYEFRSTLWGEFKIMEESARSVIAQREELLEIDQVFAQEAQQRLSDNILLVQRWMYAGTARLAYAASTARSLLRRVADGYLERKKVMRIFGASAIEWQRKYGATALQKTWRMYTCRREYAWARRRFTAAVTIAHFAYRWWQRVLFRRALGKQRDASVHARSRWILANIRGEEGNERADCIVQEAVLRESIRKAMISMRQVHARIAIIDSFLTSTKGETSAKALVAMVVPPPRSSSSSSSSRPSSAVVSIHPTDRQRRRQLHQSRIEHLESLERSHMDLQYDLASAFYIDYHTRWIYRHRKVSPDAAAALLN